MVDKLLYISVILIILILIKIVLEENHGVKIPNPIKIINNSPLGLSREHKRIYDILEPPERKYLPERSYSQSDFNYSQMGYISRNEGSSNFNPDGSNRMTLYGRKDPDNRRMYEYYVVENGVKVPLNQSKELYDGDTITVPGLSGDFNVILYDIEPTRIYDPNMF